MPDLSHEIELTPAFHDVDSMHIVWHGHYIKYLELARCALLARFDYDVPQMFASGYSWPIVDIRVKYVQPLIYRQTVRVRAEITEWENRLKVDYLIRDAASGKRITKAHTIQVAVDPQGNLQYVCPPILWQKLGVAP